MLVAAFPVLFLFAQNITQQFSLSDLWVPLLLAIGGAALLLLVALGLARAVGASAARAALAVSLLIGLAMTYGHVWNLVGESLRLHRYLLAVWALIAALGLVMIWRLAPASVRRVTVGLTVAIGALIVVNLVPIAGLAIRSVSVAAPAQEGDGPSAEPADGDARDIWYIVPDRYAGSDGLQEVYGFDNTPFLDALEERGFEVAASATSSYLKTALSLLSTLNFEELDFGELEAEATGGDDFGPIHRRLQESHAVARYLHERGYRYLHVGSVRGPTAGNAAADEVFLYSSTTEFGSVLADTTLLRALERVAPQAFAPGLEELYSAQIEFQLDALERPGRRARPQLRLRPPADPAPAVRLQCRRQPGDRRTARVAHHRGAVSRAREVHECEPPGARRSSPCRTAGDLADHRHRRRRGAVPELATPRTRTTSSGWKRSPKSSSASSRSSARSACPAWTVPASRTPASATT